MTLLFEPRREFGRLRFYPVNQGARALMDLTGRKTLNLSEVDHLMFNGFDLDFRDGKGEALLLTEVTREME